MKLLFGHKDGGPESKVWAWGLESKRLGSVLLLKFGRGSRDAYHSHAFNCVSWVLKGALLELRRTKYTNFVDVHAPGLKPIFTYRETTHQVHGLPDATWVLTFRGPWRETWQELVDGREVVLTHGRKEVEA